MFYFVHKKGESTSCPMKSMQLKIKKDNWTVLCSVFDNIYQVAKYILTEGLVLIVMVHNNLPSKNVIFIFWQQSKENTKRVNTLTHCKYIIIAT